MQKVKYLLVKACTLSYVFINSYHDIIFTMYIWPPACCQNKERSEAVGFVYGLERQMHWSITGKRPSLKKGISISKIAYLKVSCIIVQSVFGIDTVTVSGHNASLLKKLGTH